MNIDAIDPLSSEEERALIPLAQAGDEEAMLTIVRSQVPWLQAETQRFSSGGEARVDKDDLFAAGMEALILAVHSFDPSRGARLFTHARLPVGDAMMKEVATTSSATLPVPLRTFRRYRKFIREATALITVRNVEPTEDAVLALARDLAHQKSGMDPRTFNAVHFAVSGDSIHATTDRSQDEGGTRDEAHDQDVPTMNLGGDPRLLGVDAPEYDTSEEDRKLATKALAAITDERQRQVIGHTILAKNPMTDAEVAARLGVGRSTVTRIRATALAVMLDAIG